ncbi:LAO/AO transport system kinase [Propionibacteriaceae bacterium ES.041]|uniref:methylmalonyl Co-A mutase-associated GTPase MeaB n=1 Tax=Enemella evansiae TaxID=2016499 RepID=UPI000B965278|nr:methylmalonyl Co-A mutase-associated GTPase MeaB [Enemella evansiae]OYN98993.1 methylmalonyl Co-A mutase-associated GTPase MeaB [Enemella evansiae]PFG67487.1 LAO/AO transport system kinase [Propionibacteriaceae bacterium ES.041]
MTDSRVAELVEAARAGRVRAIARLISLVENNAPELPEVLRLLAPHTGRAHVIGLTGSPGVGKSTTTTALVAAYRGQGLKVGVLAVDPSSPFSGGAVLGDRVRMQKHSTDSGVYIRSMASRGHLGGLSTAAPQALRVFDLAGFDVVLVETVGVGQSEVEIAGTADTTLVLLAPGMGDGIQAAKAGILEIGDLFVVNKADRDGAQNLVRELRTMIAMAERTPEDWKPPIVRTVASAGEGIDELVEKIAAHRAHGEETGRLAERRLARSRDEIQQLALASVRASFLAGGRRGLDELAAQVRDGSLDPYAAADRLLAEVGADQVEITS